MRLSTTTLDYYSSGTNQISPAEAIERIADTGFKAVDLCFIKLNNEFFLGNDNWKKMIEDAGEAASRNGIVFSRAHVPSGPILDQGLDGEIYLERVKRSLEGSALLGIKWSAVHIADIPGPYSREHIKLIQKSNLDFYRKLFSTMERHDIGILIENSTDKHAAAPNRRRYCSTAEEMLDTIQFFNHPLVGACWDTGHANMQHLDQYEQVMMLGKTLKAIHVHDNNGDVDQHLLPFQGNMKWEPFIKALADVGYEGDFAFEAYDSVRRTPGPLKKSISELMYKTGLYLLSLDEKFKNVI
jgi:L-ribulose-5-phosphate 3-epimerase